MKAVKINSYYKQGTTTRVHVYKIVQATSAEIADYQLTQGANYKFDTEDNAPLFFTTSFEGNSIEILKGKAKDRTTGLLVDAYRAICSEDFELKRSAYTSMIVQSSIAPRITPNINNAAPVSVDNTEF
jgi:hypothetical protein